MMKKQPSPWAIAYSLTSLAWFLLNFTFFSHLKLYFTLLLQQSILFCLALSLCFPTSSRSLSLSVCDADQRSAAQFLKVIPVRGLPSSWRPDGWVDATAPSQLGPITLLVPPITIFPGELYGCAPFLCSLSLRSITKCVTQRNRLE